MTVSRRKGDAGFCDTLFSRLIRSEGQCKRCRSHAGPFDTAHIIGRRYSATRCELDNAWCLCRTCHQYVDGWAHAKMELVDSTIGRRRYYELMAQAQAGPQLSSHAFWAAERVRLTGLCIDRGIDTRRKVPT